MRVGFTRWILLAALILGLGARLCAQDPCVITDACQGKCHHHAGDGPPGDPWGDSDCPLDHHHHHGMCAHTNPFLSFSDRMSAPLPPRSFLLEVALKSDPVPDGPVLEEDVPPIV